jgi:hypothetical protein
MVVRAPILLLLAIGLTAGPALAADALSGCYARRYDAAHLARNPKQKVTVLSVLVTPGAVDPPVAANAEINATLRASTALWSTDGDCKPQGAGLICDFAETGGTALLTPRPDGIRLEVTSADGLAFEGIGLGGDGGERTFKTLTKPDDGVFLLAPAAASNCK